MGERLPISPENRVEVSSKEREKQFERLQDELERSAEQSPERTGERLDETKAEVLELLNTQEKSERKQVEAPNTDRAASTTPPRNLDKVAFSRTMDQARSHMNPAQRSFSKFIHAPVVEKTSQALENTVARPNSLLYGSLFAFVITLVVYLIAKNVGYPLSGFESIASFIAGWVFGIIFDYVRVLWVGSTANRRR